MCLAQGPQHSDVGEARTRGPSKMGPVHKTLVLIAYASNEGSDEPAHLRSLVRAFVARAHKGEDVDEGSRRIKGI